MTTKERAEAVAESCADAYSADRYGSWRMVAFKLLQKGFTDKEAEAIMRSKHMRWAGDAWEGPSCKYPSAAIMDYIERNPKEFTKKELRELVVETFGV